MTNSDSGRQSAHIRSERVRPNNGQQESLWAFLTLVLILLISGIGIGLNQVPVPEAAAHLKLNTEQKRLLTQLSSAASEIRFLAEGDLSPGHGISIENSPQWPDLETLIAFGVPPFAGSSVNLSGNAGFRWLNPKPGCFIGENASANASHFMLLMGEHLSQPAQLYSRQTALASEPCHPDAQWQHQLSEF